MHVIFYHEVGIIKIIGWSNLASGSKFSLCHFIVDNGRRPQLMVWLLTTWAKIKFVYSNFDLRFEIYMMDGLVKTSIIMGMFEYI